MHVSTEGVPGIWRISKTGIALPRRGTLVRGIHEGCLGTQTSPVCVPRQPLLFPRKGISSGFTATLDRRPDPEE